MCDVEEKGITIALGGSLCRQWMQAELLHISVGLVDYGAEVVFLFAFLAHLCVDVACADVDA